MASEDTPRPAIEDTWARGRCLGQRLAEPKAYGACMYTCVCACSVPTANDNELKSMRPHERVRACSQASVGTRSLGLECWVRHLISRREEPAVDIFVRRHDVSGGGVVCIKGEKDFRLCCVQNKIVTKNLNWMETGRAILNPDEPGSRTVDPTRPRHATAWKKRAGLGERTGGRSIL